MATQTHNNYTITNVTYSVTGGANVFASFQTAVLTITPDLGYVVNAEDFAWINTTLANIATVAANVAGVNSFAARYRVGSSDPSSDLDEGDLFYNTTSNVVKFYNGSAWVAISADTDSLVKVSSNDTTAGFLNGKLVAWTAITFVENNNGGNETLTINATDPTALAIALG